MIECATCGMEIEDSIEALKEHYAEFHPDAGKKVVETPKSKEKIEVDTKLGKIKSLNQIDPRHRPGGRYTVVTLDQRTPVESGACEYCNGTGFVYVQLGTNQVQPGVYQVKSTKKPCIVCNGDKL